MRTKPERSGAVEQSSKRRGRSQILSQNGETSLEKEKEIVHLNMLKENAYNFFR
jgi:hypothetical protein